MLIPERYILYLDILGFSDMSQIPKRVLDLYQIMDRLNVHRHHAFHCLVFSERRVDLVIGVSYEDDLKKAKTIIEGVLAQDERVLQDPKPNVAVFELGDSSVNFVVRPWAKAVDYWDAYFDITSKVKLALDENGISIPYPQQDIHLKSGVFQSSKPV